MKCGFDKMNGIVAADILENIGYGDMSHDQQKAALEDLKTNSVEELFDRWLNWNGIMGYTESIMTALDSIREVSQEGRDLRQIIDLVYKVQCLDFVKDMPADTPVTTIERLARHNFTHPFGALVRLSKS